MAQPQSDYTYIHGIVTGFLATVGVAGFLGGLVFLMGVKWANHVNQCLKEVYQRFKDWDEAKDARWQKQIEKCERHGERLAYLEARINGKDPIRMLKDNMGGE